MALRSLLVPITGLAGDKIVLDAAYHLGRTFESHISVSCIRPDPTDVVRYAVEWSYPILMDEAVTSAERHSKEIEHRAHRVFDLWRQNHDLPVVDSPTPGGVTVSWQEHIGASGPVLGDLARFADLVIMRNLGEKPAIEGDAMLELVLIDAGRPVLLIPGSPVDTLSGTALIAWDGGRKSLRAMNAALPLLARMGTVQIVTVDSDAGTKAEELATYLAWQGIAADIHLAERGAANIGDVLLEEAHQIGAGLLVMGGYHHSRTRELLFGGTTRRIISAAKIPVMLAH